MRESKESPRDSQDFFRKSVGGDLALSFAGGTSVASARLKLPAWDRGFGGSRYASAMDPRGCDSRRAVAAWVAMPRLLRWIATSQSHGNPGTGEATPAAGPNRSRQRGEEARRNRAAVAKGSQGSCSLAGGFRFNRSYQ